MNLKQFALNLAPVTLLCLAAGVASAATIATGSFTLPAQTYWGNTVLPAGDYHLSLMREQSGIDYVVVRGEGKEAIVMTQAGSEESSGHGHLMLDEVGGAYVVRELDMAGRGRAYHFAVPKAVRDLTLRGSLAHPAEIPLRASL